MELRWRTAVHGLVFGLSFMLLPGVHADRMLAGLDELVVSGQRQNGSPTAPAEGALRDALARIPGGVDLHASEDFEHRLTTGLADSLFLAPGVVSQAVDSRELRLVMRGNGLGTSFERRGVALLRDGMPLTSASGSSNFQEVDPLALAFLEVLRGGHGQRLGAASLGGAVNLRSRTGAGQPGTRLQLESGSYGDQRLSLASGGQAGDLDAMVVATARESDGYRQQNALSTRMLHANLGWQVSDRVAMRGYLDAGRLDHELAGALSLDMALTQPRRAAPPVGPFFPGGPVLDPGAVADDWRRDLEFWRLAQRTVIAVGDAGQLELGGHYTRRDMDHPITRFAGLIDQSGEEYGLFARLEQPWQLGQRTHLLRLGVHADRGSIDARVFENRGGQPGALRQAADQRAANVTGYGQLELELAPRWLAVLGSSWLWSEREQVVRDGPIEDARLREQAWAPHLGLIWQLHGDWQLFASLTRSFEAPSFAELTGSGTTSFLPLEPQRGWTRELGVRGGGERMQLGLTLFDARVRDELLKFGEPDAQGFVSFVANADRTRHRGLEAGLDWILIAADNHAGPGELTLRQAWTWSDFRFRDDAEFGNNRLAGLPTHSWRGELRYDHGERWHLALGLDHVAGAWWADFANTTRVPTRSIWQASAGWHAAEWLELRLAVRNLTDRAHVVGVATNADQAEEAGRIFHPGTGRSVQAGVVLRW